MLPLNAQDAARRLIAGEQAATQPPSDAVAATERVIRRLAHELSSWVGPYGARALLTRALTDVQEAHPVLVGVRVGIPPAPDLDGLAESARTHGGVAAAAGTAVLLAALLELLARLIGDDIAATLVAQNVRAAAPDRSAAGGHRDASTSASEDAPSAETRVRGSRDLPDGGTDDGTDRAFGRTRDD